MTLSYRWNRCSIAINKFTMGPNSRLQSDCHEPLLEVWSSAAILYPENTCGKQCLVVTGAGFISTRATPKWISWLGVLDIFRTSLVSVFVLFILYLSLFICFALWFMIFITPWYLLPFILFVMYFHQHKSFLISSVFPSEWSLLFCFIHYIMSSCMLMNGVLFVLLFPWVRSYWTNIEFS
jgi:hypothetical protein